MKSNIVEVDDTTLCRAVESLPLQRLPFPKRLNPKKWNNEDK